MPTHTHPPGPTLRLRLLQRHVVAGPSHPAPAAAATATAAAAAQPPPVKFLEGCRVVELANWIAGPTAGAMLADFGADVIKVEPPEGDGMRYMYALTQAAVQEPDGSFRRQTAAERGQYVDMPWQQENRGKRSITVALGTPQGQAVVHRLLADADVLVTNLLPSRLERYGLDSTTLSSLSPQLIIAAVSAYGEDGPDKDLPGFDGGA